MILSNPKVSIVIRTLNESKYLGQLLVSIQNQTYKNTEIILVDSGSTDGTIEIAKKMNHKVLEIEQDDFTFGYAINHGIQNSTGDLICIISAHTLPATDLWLEELVSGFYQTTSNGQIALSYGKQLGNEQSNYSEIRDFSRMYGEKEQIQKKPDYFCNNANSMILKKLWSEHPFDEALTGLEDLEWAKFWMDKGYNIVYKPNASVYHFHSEKADQIKRRFWREAIAARSIGVFPAWKIISQIPFQTYLFFADILQALMKKKHLKIGDIFTYRMNNLMGKLKSLTDKKFDLRDYKEQYAANKYDVLEFSSQNNVKKTEYVLNPLKPNDVLIKVHYVGVCETDLEVLRGNLGYYKTGWAKYPIVPGHEFSGVISRIGSKVNNFSMGDKVVGQCILSCGTCSMCLSGRSTACLERKEVGVLNYDGGYAEYVTLKSRYVHKLPDDVSLLSASSIEPLAVVHKAFNRIGLYDVAESEREKILIIGSGPMGHLSARLGQLWGHEITVYDLDQNRLNYLKDIPITTLNKEPDFHKFSIIIECTGNDELAANVIEKSSAATTILLLGLPYNKKLVDLENIVSFDKKIVGSVGSNAGAFEAAIRLAGQIDLTNFNDTIFEFDDWSKAWAMHKTKNKLKVKLKMGH
jgi:threonine dehydrogenase-like Zn-dependent dehydrogenase/GT2 family glycosyltransferase